MGLYGKAYCRFNQTSPSAHYPREYINHSCAVTDPIVFGKVLGLGTDIPDVVVEDTSIFVKCQGHELTLLIHSTECGEFLSMSSLPVKNPLDHAFQTSAP